MLYSPVFFFVVLAFLVVLVLTPAFKAADLPPTTDTARRVTTLDGSRGFLALAVFFHHAAIYHGYLASGTWTVPPSHFYTILGPFGVAVFFMITGFLFWGKLIDEAGRPNWIGLYLGRLFRIGPLYLATIAALIVAVFAHTGWQLHGTLFGLLKTCAFWASLGMLGQGGPINHYADTWVILAGVTWTLWFEWLFYAALVPLSLLAGNLALFFALGSCIVLFGFDALLAPKGVIAPPLTCACLFSAGMAAASLLRTRRMHWVSPVSSATMAVLLIALCLLPPDLNGIAPLLGLGTVFILVASGCDLFGLLTSRAALRLGDMSYGLYLLQGLVLDAIFSIPALRRFALSSTGGFWAVVTIAAATLVCCATLTLVTIERPGVALGRRLGRSATSRYRAHRHA